MNTTIDRIVGLMQSKDITAKQLTKDLEMSVTAVSDWKKHKVEPSIDALVKISNYFHVSLDYLVFGKTGDTTVTDLLTEDEMDMLTKYRTLSVQQKIKVNAYVDGIIDAGSKIYL